MNDKDSSVWLRLLGTRDTLTNLAAIDTTILKNGALAFVTEVGDYYSLQKGSTAVADGINIVQSTTGSAGRWFRLETGASPAVGSQVNWYVDPQNVSGTASDANDGATAASALLTYDELSRRLDGAVLEQSTTVHQISSPALPGDLYWAQTTQGGLAQGTLLFSGEAATLLTTQVLTGAQDEDAVAGTQCEITVAGFDWTPYIGERVRITVGGDVGYVAWIQDTGGTVATARMSTNPVNTAGGAGNFLVGDTVVVEDLTEMAEYAGQGRSVWENQNPTTFQNLLIGRANYYADFSSCTFIDCDLDCSWLTTRGRTQVFGCHLNVVAGKFYSSNRLLFQGSWLECQSLECDGEVTFAGTNSSTFAMSILAEKVVVSGPLAFWDWIGTAAIVFEFGTAADLQDRIWGTSAGGGTYGIRIQGGVQANFNPAAGNTPTVAGALAGTKDLEVGDTDLEYTTVIPGGFINPLNNAAIVPRAA